MKKRICMILAVLLSFALMMPASFSVSAADTAVLQGKTVLVVGDDICNRSNGGWGGRLEDMFGMSAIPMHSGSGVSISDWRKESKGTTIVSQIGYAYTKGIDYVLLHGGMADAENDGSGSDNAVEGVVTGAVDLNNYTIPDTPETQEARTFAAGMERLIQATIKKYNGKRIGFIINYATPNNPCQNARDMSKYWDIARQVCDKWNVPYLDLYAGKSAEGELYSNDILDMDNPKSKFHSNNKFLTADGYDKITPYIAQWMATLQPYSLEATLATAPTTTTTKRSTTTKATTTTTGGVTTSKTASVKTDHADSTDADTTKTVAESTTNTSKKKETTTSALSQTNGQESAPESSAPDEYVDGEQGGGNALPIVLTVVTVAAAVAVLTVLGIVIFKRFKT